MHKKLFTAVLALGLLLVANSVAFAIALPASNGEVPVTAFGSNVSKAGFNPGMPELATDPLVSVNAGQNRTVPGTFSEGDWQGAFGFTVGGWYVGDEFYAAIQDPATAANWGAGGPVLNSPSFDVTAINTIWRLTTGFPATFMFQPLVFPPGPAGCTYDGVGPQPAPVAGGASCVGPLYAVTWTAAASFIINMPFPVECCQSGPYYAAYYAPTPGPLRIGLNQAGPDTDPNGPGFNTACFLFNDYGTGWDELTGNYFNGFDLSSFGPPFGTDEALDHMLWSEGYTPDDPGTHCNPGTCTYEYYYDPLAAPAFAFGLPSGSGGGRDALGIWTEAVGLDTLTEVVFAMNGPTPAVPADITIEIFAANFAGSACSGVMPGVADVPVYSQVVPGGSIAWGGYTVVPLTTPYIWGTLNGGPSQRIVVSLADYSAGTTNGLLANNDDGTCVGAHFVARYPVIGEWLNVFDVSGIAPEPYIELLICREVLPAVEEDCGVPLNTNDQWANYAHDAGRTSASDIRVGDPNQVTAAWANPLPNSVNFTNPTVKNDIVYISRDVAVDAFSLTTGAPVGTATGNPEMSVTGLRGNTTIAFTRGIVSGPDRDLAFTGGGTFPAVSAWETNLETSGPVPLWSRSGASPPSLAQQNRYATSLVVDIGGTDVLITGTEPLAGTGRLWAHVAGTGALYAGWATNPIVLDAAVKHGPAINGSKLYVATCIGGSNVSGSLYQINLADGAVDWNFVGVPGEGWPSGVSTEGAFVYGATKDAGNNGYRYKIDVSGALPAVVWTAGQGVGLYGTPTIGGKFVYFPLDNPSSGLLQVDKSIGTVARNFAATDDLCGTTVFQIPMHVTLSCDAYIFAGDRAGHWWCLNAIDGTYEWFREFPGVVMGTALASDAAGDDYAVVAVQSGTPSGLVSAYKFNSGSRPRLIQCLYDTQILVSLNSGAGQPHSEPGVFTSIGDQDVVFSSYSIADPLPGATASTTVRRALNNMIEASREFDGYTTIANAASITKRQRIAGLSSESIDGGERTSIDQLRDKLAVSSSRTSAPRSMAASASAIRTSAVTMNGSGFPYNLTPGSTGDLDWLFDGTGLGRATDVNVIEFTNNDPDFNFDAVNNGSISIAEFQITYIGGCPPLEDTLLFGPGNNEHVFNYGGLGEQGRADAWLFANDPIDPTTNLYDSGLMLLGDSTAGVDGGAQTRIEIYRDGGTLNHFVPNTSPVGNACGFDHYADVLMGAKRTGGCPGVPADIHGNIIVNSISDTDFAAPAGTRLAAIGMDIIQTEVGANDPLYGDFKLIQWEVVNRDAVAKGPIYIGSWSDWDVVNNYAVNTGNFSAAANGYYIWDQSGAGSGNAYGCLDPSHRSTYSGIQPMNPAYRLVIHNNTARQGGAWPNTDLELIWSESISETPAYGVDAGGPTDKAGLMINAAMNFGPNGSVKRYQAYYGVDATSNTDATIATNVLALAKRAARWGGFARGDVNDDGLVDLADVCWLQGGNFIYPAAYSGDVDADGDNDAADITRLLSFVSGNAASQPEGAWRF